MHKCRKTSGGILTNHQLMDILSIDGGCAAGEVDAIKLSIQLKEKEVIEFLSDLKNIIQSEAFNIDNDLTVIKSKKKLGKEQYSTPYTLLDLEYDASDIVERLKELSIREYSETLVDKDDLNPPLLFVFGKDINGKQIYIKLKIKGDQARRILCVSFHYAEEKMSFPYV